MLQSLSKNLHFKNNKNVEFSIKVKKFRFRHTNETRLMINELQYRQLMKLLKAKHQTNHEFYMRGSASERGKREPAPSQIDSIIVKIKTLVKIECL